VTECVKELPPELDLWITHCLANDPERRCQSSHEFALILRGIFGTPKISTRFKESGSSAKIESLAVLPFFTSSNSPDAEYLADGIK
jgi:hypothetical protein